MDGIRLEFLFEERILNLYISSFDLHASWSKMKSILFILYALSLVVIYPTKFWKLFQNEFIFPCIFPSFVSSQEKFNILELEEISYYVNFDRKPSVSLSLSRR